MARKMIDTSYARSIFGDKDRLYAQQFSSFEWRSLQENYEIGELLMPCCNASAVPKTSPNGLQFFSHASGQCSSSPEGIWHLQSKEIVAEVARELGFKAIIEHSLNGVSRPDVYLDIDSNPVAIELQHSYQHIRDYQARQKKYESIGVRCLWLVTEKRYRSLTKSMSKQRFINEFDRCWPYGEGACLREFQVAILDLDEKIVMGPKLRAPLKEVISAFVANRLLWESGCWIVID